MEFESLIKIINFYNNMNKNKHIQIYNTFNYNVENYNNGILKKHFENSIGYGELAFAWNWYLLVNEMNTNFKFLEIGVYKGRVLSLIKLLSNLLNKNAQIWGITPLCGSGDKYSNYDTCDYLNQIKSSFINNNISFENTQIIKGFSENMNVINKAKENMYDIIFIDGCHDYENVCLDINNYSKMLKSGGYLVMNDASLYVNDAYGTFLGHPDVGRAIIYCLDNNNDFIHLYSVGHIRVWRKK